MRPTESFNDYERRRTIAEALSPTWLPYLGVVLAAYFFYCAVSLLVDPGRAAVQCSGRGQLLCRLIFDPLQFLLSGRGTNVVYSLVFVLAGAIVGFGSAKRLMNKCKKTDEMRDAI
ncbi:hypothetical protein MCEMIEM13_00219 [Comamonadaceae bacterium]